MADNYIGRPPNRNIAMGLGIVQLFCNFNQILSPCVQLAKNKETAHSRTNKANSAQNFRFRAQLNEHGIYLFG